MTDSCGASGAGGAPGASGGAGTVIGNTGVQCGGPGGGGGGAGGQAGGAGSAPQVVGNGGQGGNGGNGGAHGLVVSDSLNNTTALSAGAGTDGTDGSKATGARNNFDGGGGGGGAGGYGLVINGGSSFSNSATISGGGGGNGGNVGGVNGDSNGTADGGNGGGGGLGVWMNTGDASLENAGTITGGVGGQGGLSYGINAGFDSSGGGGRGGAGGAGVYAKQQTGSALTNSSGANIIGGAGGKGGDDPGLIPGPNVDAGFGGSGGAGVDSVSSVRNLGAIAGGAGGDAGQGNAAGTVAPYNKITQQNIGGDGGNGIINSAGTVINSGTVSGGNGGAGGVANTTMYLTYLTGYTIISSNGGAGGTGISATNTTITNSGTVSGGNGGAGAIDYAAVHNASNGNGGNGGDGVRGAGLFLINSGTITAGTGGAAGSGIAGVDGVAVNLLTSANGNTLEIRNGSNIQGTARAAGTKNTFILGGDEDATFSGTLSSTLDSSSDYQGFQTYQKTGTSTWTLASTYTNNWQIRGGTLQVGDSGVIGDSATIDTGSGTDSGFLAYNQSAGTTTTFGNLVTGTGGVRQAGAGTLVLTNWNNSYTGGTQINGGTLSVSSDDVLGAASGILSFNGGTLQVTGTTYQGTGRTINWGANGGGFDIANQNNSFTVSQLLTGQGQLTKSGDGKLIMIAKNTYAGDTTISAGVLQLGDGANQANDGAISGDIINNASLVVANLGASTLAGTISGTGSLTQNGSSTLTLSGDNSYTGNTNLNAGTIVVSQDENLGAAGLLNFDGGVLEVTGTDFTGFDANRAITWGTNGGGFDIDDADNTFTPSNVFTGTGALAKSGAGTLALTGDSSAYTGGTSVNGGALRLDDGSLGGNVTVASGASFGGQGTVGGAADVKSGGTLFGRSGQVLNFQNGLTLDAGSSTDVTISGGPSDTGLFHVDNGLTTAGTLTVNPNSTFGIGVYRIFDSTSPITDNGMALASASDPNYQLQMLATQGQVNLVNTGGRNFQYWDGTTMIGDGTVHGGNGTWNAANTNWTGIDGNGNIDWQNDTFAVFQGAAGTVTVQNGFVPSVNGMQFLTTGYTLTGGPVQLGSAENRVLVGDGNISSANVTATIASELQGQNGFTKSGYGTLILTAANSYSGTTTVNEGTLALGDGGSIDNSSDIALAGTAYDHGDLLINKSGQFTLGNTINGIGTVTKDGSGTTVFTGNNSFSGGLTVAGGAAQAGIANIAFGTGTVSVKTGATLDLNNFNETVGNLSAFDKTGAVGDGNITLGSGTLTLNQTLHGDFSGQISGAGGLIMSDSSTASLTLTGQNNYSGTTTVNGGELVQGAQGAFSSASGYAVGSGGALDLGGFSTGMASLNNAGTVSFGGTGGTVLNVAGDYNGNGGTLGMSTVLAGDDSQTDMLKVGGNTSGSTVINVTNRGGLGAQTVNGIKLIDVGGSSDGNFALQGDYVTKDGQQAIMTPSAYAYTLQKNSATGPNDGNWYLVSQNTNSNPTPPNCEETNNCPPPPKPGPRYSAAAPVYEAYASTLQALNKLPTLQQRIGDRYFNDTTALRGTPSGDVGETDNKAIWGRIEGAHNRLEPGTTTDRTHQDVDTFIMQAGVDGQFYEDDSGRLIGGITGQYGNSHSSVSSYYGDGTINTQGWGLGANATWYGNNGFYVDGQAQLNWYDSDLYSDSANKGLTDSNKGFGYALGVETGKRFAMDEHWSLTPQAQLMFSSVGFDTFTDNYGARISDHDSNSLTGRLGLAASYASNWKGENGKMVNTSVYGIANLYQEFLGGTVVDYSGTRMNTDNDSTWGGIGAGGTYAWADDKYVFYGEGSLNTSLNHFADSYAIKGNIGFKVKW
ncbi:autotransporter outer membrane beta-barrel domain-containing protein [Brucella sp. LJL56]